MKNKIAKTLIAVTLCTAMLGSTAFAAEGPGVLDNDTDNTNNSIVGDADFVSPIYKIVVPTKLEFAIDPFEQKGQSGIYSKDFGMINKSNVPVRLDCSVTVTPKSGVTLKASADAVSEADDSKQAYIAAEIAGEVVETSADAAAYAPTALVKDGTDYYDADLKTGSDLSSAADADEMTDTTAVAGKYDDSVKVGLGTDATKLTFVLDAADYTTYYTALDKSATASTFKNVAASQAGSASFRFSGTVNTKADWAAQDISAKVVYEFIGLSGENYTALKEDNKVDNAHAYVVEKQNVLQSDGTKDIVIYYTGTKPTSVVLTPVNTTGTNKAAMTVAADKVVITNETVTLLKSVVSGLANSEARGTGTYKVTINDKDYVLTFTK